MKAINIKWRDGENVDLPTEVELPDYIETSYDIEEWLFDGYGYIVESYDIED